MAWFTRVTRFGDVHEVFGQERECTCSVACVIMAAFKIHKMTWGPKKLFSEAEILRLAKGMGYTTAISEGLKGSELLQLLNHPDLGMPGWKFEQLRAPAIPGTIIRKVGVTGGVGPVLSVNPVIVSVKQWNDSFGHSVLVDTVRSFFGKTYATVCDPWDANVHIVEVEEEDNTTWFFNERYKGTTPPVGVNFWGAPMGEYPSRGIPGYIFSGKIHSRSK